MSGTTGASTTSAKEQNTFIERHGFEEYGKWHLGIDKSEPEDSKKRYSFPYAIFVR